MSKKQKLAAACGLLLVILLNIGILNWSGAQGRELAGKMTVSSDVSDHVQVFYSGPENAYAESMSTLAAYPAEGEQIGSACEIDFAVGSASTFIRIDFGAAHGTWDVRDVSVSYGGAVDDIDLNDAAKDSAKTDISDCVCRDGVLHVETKDGDPHIIIPVDLVNTRAQAERPGLRGTRSEETDDARADFGVDGEIQEGMLGRKEDSGRVPVVLSEVAQVMKISDALDAECETVALERAVGRVCADFVILYPPDVPLIVPGEIYTEEKVSEIRGWIERGFSVMGVDE